MRQREPHTTRGQDRRPATRSETEVSTFGCLPNVSMSGSWAQQPRHHCMCRKQCLLRTRPNLFSRCSSESSPAPVTHVHFAALRLLLLSGKSRVVGDSEVGCCRGDQSASWAGSRPVLRYKLSAHDQVRGPLPQSFELPATLFRRSKRALVAHIVTLMLKPQAFLEEITAAYEVRERQREQRRAERVLSPQGGARGLCLRSNASAPRPDMPSGLQRQTSASVSPLTRVAWTKPRSSSRLCACQEPRVSRLEERTGDFALIDGQREIVISKPICKGYAVVSLQTLNQRIGAPLNCV